VVRPDTRVPQPETKKPKPRLPVGRKSNAARAAREKRQQRKDKAAGLTTSVKRGGATPTKKKAKRRGKYNAKGEYVNGQWCASASEAVRYRQLLELEAKGVIVNLECQPRFDCLVNNQKVCAYVADFRYEVIDDVGNVLRTPVEDVKGMITDIYKIKRKLVMACHQLEIIEIPARKVAKWDGHTS
jgi:hypothetical protein